ncbi:membrane protein insertase YidC [Arenimonas terrae]|uniref:Membrane protein insertase YidC n=1 Tax=Arenimonas terrae TaxID=2546226 RepID=A0A5C4RS04_9GAMM|nr:membrane protein insertase YidC [Arenimonas terrae]TNJ33347.1 membrane protein insertase YidC [Arenimonas terrae]
MNQTRSFLLIAWLFVAVLLFMEWNKGPVAPAVVDAPATASLPTAGETPSAAALPSAGAVPVAPAGTPPTAAPAAATLAPITVTTNVLRLQLDPRGGNLVGADLLAYPVTKEQPDTKVRLLDSTTAHYSVAQSGLLATAGSSAPNHEAVFRTEDGRSDYRLADGAQTLEVPLVWTDAASGVTVRKTLVLERGSYAITQRLEIRNQGAQPWSASPYEQLQRVVPPEKSSTSGLTNPEAYSFVGAAWYSPSEKFEKIAIADLFEDGAQSRDVTGGWIAMLQHHFVLAWVPNKAEAQRFEMAPLPDNNRYLVRGVSAPIQVAPGLSTTRESVLWVGPKLQKQLEQIAPGLKLTLDYGIFTFLAQPMFDYVLKPLHDLTGNWGWAIILTVLIIKIALYWLSAKQYRSFAKMRAIQPRIEALKERYGDDKQKFQMAMMELYKKEKVNPAAGCLPILVTIPVFIALYWMLLESVEMRQAPWIGWIQNLTAPDPYFILPAINLAVMYLTQKMTPTPGMDPMQKKIMTFMPLVFGVMMAFFPSGLVLYWCTNGILGLLQQWVITKRHGDKPEAGTPVAAK